MKNSKYFKFAIFLMGFIIIIVGLLFAYLSNNNQSHKNAAKKPLVGITQIVTHPGLDEIRKGIIEGLAQNEYVDGKNMQIIFRNANGDQALTMAIAEDFARRNVSVAVPITTPSALSMAKVIKNKPIVFAGVSDPVGVGLVKDLKHPGSHITGTSDQWPFEKQIETYVNIVPSTKTIGMLYTPGDDVAKLGVNAVREYAKKHNLKLVLQPVSSAGDVYSAAVSLAKRVDVIYTGIDILVAENLHSVIKAGNETNTPILGGDAGAVDSGAIMALAVSMKDLGKITGEMVAEVLNGKSPATMPVRVVKDGDLIINKAVAAKYGLNMHDILRKYPNAQLK